MELQKLFVGDYRKLFKSLISYKDILRSPKTQKMQTKRFMTSNKNRINILCRNCGKEFEVPNYRRDTAKFCSNICKNRFKKDKTYGEMYGLEKAKKINERKRIKSLGQIRNSFLGHSIKECKCGCGQLVIQKKYRRWGKFQNKPQEYISGHNNPENKFKEKEKVIKICKNCGKEFKVTPSLKNKRVNCSKKCHGEYISKLLSGKKNPFWKEKIKVICKTCQKEFEVPPWRKEKGVKFCSMECYSKDMKGNIPWNKNKKISKELYPNFGMRNRKHPKWVIKKMSLAKVGKYTLDKHPNWLGGKSFEPYGIEFNNKLKEEIRKRDNFMCQECGKNQEELKRKLYIHHIDYNKKNNSPFNLISLCLSCHVKTNFEREHWQRYFQNIMALRKIFNPENLLIFNKNKQLIGVKRI